jgi:glycosyltransferase involved in cell wall biosynthesis
MVEAARESGLLAGSQLLDDARPRPIDGEHLDGLDAPVAVICGDPGHVASVYVGHLLRYLVLAPNSNGIPPVVKGFLNDRFMETPRIDGFLAPSEWAAHVLRREFPTHDVIVSPHGVSKTFRYGRNRDIREVVRNEYVAGLFHVVHVTSTSTDRKGTPQLIEAWRKLNWKGAKLAILCHPLHLEQYTSALRGLPGAAALPTMGMSEDDIYLDCYSAAHVVCQPSRAEGFGLVPLEARCSGVPVVMTGATGHSQHIAGSQSRGMSYIYSGDDGPIEDYMGATAPTVSIDKIADALEISRECWEELNAEAISAAPHLAEEWTWRAQNEAALRRLVEKAQSHRARTPRHQEPA